MSLLQRVGRSSVVLKNLKLDTVGLQLKTSAPMIPPPLCSFSTALQMTMCLLIKGSIISQDGELVRSGDFIELASCQV